VTPDPKSRQGEEAIEFLRNDSQARIIFVDEIAEPVPNKMSDHGMNFLKREGLFE